MSVAGGVGESGEAFDDITITDAIRAALRAEIRRTGATALKLLKGRSDLPAGLDARIVNRWIGGLIRTAPRSYIAYVTSQWAALPDHPGRAGHGGLRRGRLGRRQAKAGETWIEITDAMRDDLRGELARTGLIVPRLFDGVESLPYGLNRRVVNGWLYGEIGRADAACWTFVMGFLRDRTTNS